MTGNPGMCGNKHEFVGSKFCQECGHAPGDYCHIKPAPAKVELLPLANMYRHGDHVGLADRGIYREGWANGRQEQNITDRNNIVKALVDLIEKLGGSVEIQPGDMVGDIKTIITITF